MNTTHRTVRLLGAAVATSALIVAGASAAQAHVTVSPDDTGANGYSHLTFDMPNESATARSDRLEVRLPTDTPFTSVAVKPVDGWSAQVITSDLPKPVTIGGSTVTKAPSSIVWTANDAAHEIGQNQYQSFSISVGKLPGAGTRVVLPAAQTYTDGTIVNWDQTAQEGQPEPKHPAPSFITTAANDATPSVSGSAAAPPLADPASMTSEASGAWGLTLGTVGAVLGAAALALVLNGRRRVAKK